AEGGGERSSTAPVELPPIRKVPRDKPLPLSYPQERVWFLQQLDPTSVAYNFQLTLWFDGPLDVEALRRTLTEIVRRHEVFQVRFPAIDGKPQMIFEGPWEVDLPQVDLRHLPEDERDDAAEEILVAETKNAFDVSVLPLLRWKLVRLADERHMLIQVEHHVVHDGWTIGILMKEIPQIYKAFEAGRPSPLEDLEMQYPDFAAWQREVVSGDVLGGLVDYWRNRLEGMPTVLDLPTDHPRPNRPSTKGDALVFALPADLYGGLREFGREHGYTLYMLTLAAFYTFLHRYTHQEDIGVGAGVANRRQREQETMAGMMVNTIIMRGDLSGDPTFLELMRRVRETAVEAYAHQDMPFERLVEAIRPERHVSRNPIFQAMFSFHDAEVPSPDFGGVRARGKVRTNRSAKTDINIIVAPQAEQRVGLEEGRNEGLAAMVTWEYNRELFEPETIERMVHHYLSLAADAIANPHKRLSQLSMLEDDERTRLREWGERPGEHPKDATVHGLFRQKAQERPDAVAVRCGDASLTYGELAARAARLGRHLRGMGVVPETAVALAVGRGVELPVAQLAVLEAGGYFVPLDSAYPQERLAVMLEDSGAGVILRHGD
ncbi:MAG: condensation domain-containing protein, partial [Acidobacteriota bacterium]